jgi:AcrR family transcriptional regulator
MPDTKTRILDAAERLFADHGYEATSLRAITAAANVNLAAVNYHFRSKDSLIREVISRRLAPLKQERLLMLDAFEAKAKGRPVALENLARALVLPAIRIMNEPDGGGTSFARLLGRMYASPNPAIQKLFFSQIDEAVGRFVSALRRSLPGLTFEETACRLFFGIGVLSHTMACNWLLPMISGGTADFSDLDRTVDRIVDFFVAGLKTPPSGSVRRQRRGNNAAPQGK